MLNWFLSLFPEATLYSHLLWRFQRQVDHFNKSYERTVQKYAIDQDQVERAKRQPIGEDDDIFNDTIPMPYTRPRGAVPVGTFGWDGEEPATPMPPPEAPPPEVDLDQLRLQRLQESVAEDIPAPVLKKCHASGCYLFAPEGKLYCEQCDPF